MMRLPGLAHRFRVGGLNLERFLNLLQKEGIPLLRVVRTDAKGLLCECFSADLSRICALADEKGWKVQDICPIRWSAKLQWIKHRPGVPVGAALALMLVMIASQFVWVVDIRGAGSYQAEIAAYLSESGYGPGRLRRSVDARALENDLTYRYPEIAWFHAHVSGVVLRVDVTHGVPMPSLPTDASNNVIATRGGIVQSLRVYAGTARVKAGDIVRKGQVLIEGVERGSDGELTAVHARGIVMARCWEQHTVTMPLHDTISHETGRETVFWRIRTPLWEQPIPGADYLAYNTYIDSRPIVGAFFPVQLDRITQREVMMESQPRDVEQVQQEAAQAALEFLKNKRHDIIDKWVDYCMIEDGSLAATATVEWLINIGGDSSP